MERMPAWALGVVLVFVAQAACAAETTAQVVSPAAAPATPAMPPRLVSVERIWDKAAYNSFTDLVRFKERWYCAFREGTKHVSPDGALRVIVSEDGKTWESVALMTSPTADLRDPKLSVMPDGRLLMLGAAAPHSAPRSRQPMAWTSDDGRRWSDPADVGEKDVWLWRVTWHAGTGYGVGYDVAAKKFSRLYATRDGRKFEPVAPDTGLRDAPTEAALVFTADGTCYCLHRRDGKQPTGQLGTAAPPYTAWTWRDLGQRIGGPAMIQLPDGRFVAVVRLVAPKTRTALCWVDVKAGTLTEALALPSGGDTSYAGLVWHDNRLWISYYSSHEKKTAVYLARVAFGPGD